MKFSLSVPRRTVAAVSAVACLIIPWFVPTAPVLSESYAFGFSNSALFVCIIAVFIVPVLVMGRFGTKLVGHINEAPSNWGRESLTALAGTRPLLRLGFLLFLIAASYILLISSGLEGYAEAEYFLVRAKLMSSGLQPYVDFEYAYGCVMLFGLTGLARLGLSTSVAQALLVLGEAAVGYLSLYAIVASVFKDQKRPGQLTFAALMVATALFLTSAGQNYTFFRFATPLLIGCIFFATPRRANQLTPFFSGVVFTAAWLISPEVSLAVTVAFVLISVAQSERKMVAVPAVLASLAVAILLNPWVLPSFKTIFEFSRGGNNFPAFPSFHIFMLLLSIYLATVLVSKHHVSERSSIWFIYIASVGMLPGAIGRCDAVHVTFYSFGFFVLASYRILVEKSYRSSVPHVVCAITLSIISMLPWIYYPQVLGKAIFKVGLDLLGPGVADKFIVLVPASYRAKARLWFIAQAAASDKGKLQHAGYSMLSARSDVGDLERFRHPYMVTLNNATTVASLNQLGSQLKGQKVLVPEKLINEFCGTWKPDYRLMNVLFLFPTQIFPQKNRPELVKIGFCTFLTSMSSVEENPESVPQGYKLLSMP